MMMNNDNQEISWEELQNLWSSAASNKQISLQMAGLLQELKNKTSQFEKDLIQQDMDLLKASWSETSTLVSEFETQSIHQDLKRIKRWIKKWLHYLGNKE